MAFSQTDLQNVESAILALATGQRVVRVTVGDLTTQYSEQDIDKLRALRSEIQAEINASAGRARFVLTSTSKGL